VRGCYLYTGTCDAPEALPAGDRGKALPALVGRYLFADYCTAMIRSLRWTGERVEDLWDWRPTLDPGSRLAKLSSFGEDADGELYLLSLEGTVYRFDPAR